MVVLIIAAGALVLSRPLFFPSGEDETSSATGLETTVAGSPREAVDRYVSLWLDRDFAAMQQMTAGTQAGFLEAHRSWASVADVATADIEVAFSRETSSRASWQLTTEFSFITGDEWSYESDLELMERDGRWFVDWSPRTVHPDLGAGDTLRATLAWPDRGRILARDGTPLTDDRRVVQIGVVPERIENVADVSNALVEHLGVGEDSVSTALGAPGVQPDWFLPIATVRPWDYRVLRPHLYPVPGIVFRETTARLGPGGFATHVLGSVGEITAEQLEQLGDPYRVGDSVGQFGLERAMESALAGAPGVRVTRLDPAGETVDVLFESSGGASQPVTTTLDVVIQRAVERALDGVSEPIALVVLDTKSAAIRGVATRPLDEFNRALAGRYPPGSTFKVVTAAALLGEGLTSQSRVECPSQVDVGGRVLRNAGEFGLGSTSLLDAFARSCNTTFGSLGAGLTAERLVEVAEEFGFNELYELPLAVAGGQFPRPESSPEQAAASIGQARVLASPVHMASVAAAAASGSWNAPHLLVSSDTAAPTSLATNLEALHEMMRAVVTTGTGTAANVEGDPVFGKTGSAEFGEGDPPPTHAWFIGFRGDLAFAVLVEGGGSGGEVAAPVAAEFLNALDDEITVGSQGKPGCVQGSWPTFQGTMARSGCAVAPSILEPDLVWRQEVGIQAWLNSPVISGDRVYVGSAGLRRGESDQRDGVYSLSLRDGRVLWRHGADNDVNGVAVSDTTVVATGDQGEVWALDADDGTPRWVFRKEDSLFFTNPLIVNDMVIVGSSDGILYALDLDTGLTSWTAEFDSALRGGASSDGEAIYAVGEAGDVRAFSLDGQEYWREKISFATLNAETLTARVFAAPTIVGDLIVIPYVRDDVYPVPALMALDRYTGSVRWEASDPDRIRGRWGNLRSAPALVGDLLVFGDPTFPGIAAIGAEDGQAKWSIPAGKTCIDQWPSPAVAGEMLVLPQADGGVYAFNPEDRTLVWSVFLGIRPGNGDFPIGFDAMSCSALDPIQASPAVAPDGSIVVGTVEGDLVRIGEGF